MHFSRHRNEPPRLSDSNTTRRSSRAGRFLLTGATASAIRRDRLEILRGDHGRAGLGSEPFIPHESLTRTRIPPWKRSCARSTSRPPTSPVVIMSGMVLRHATAGALAEYLGLRPDQGSLPERCFDLVVVGGGPGGLAAAMYGASEGLRHARDRGGQVVVGGQAGTRVRRIENYLGFPTGIFGHRPDAAARSAQARKFERPARLTPYRAVAAGAGQRDRHVVQLEEESRGRTRVRSSLATGAPRTAGSRSTRPRGLRGRERVRRRRARRRRELRGASRVGGRRRRQLRRPGGRLARAGRGARDAPPPPRRPGRDDVRLPDPRARTGAASSVRGRLRESPRSTGTDGPARTR